MIAITESKLKKTKTKKNENCEIFVYLLNNKNKKMNPFRANDEMIWRSDSSAWAYNG